MAVKTEAHQALVGHSDSPRLAHTPPASIAKMIASRAPLVTLAQALDSHRALGRPLFRTHTRNVAHVTASHAAPAIKALLSKPESQDSNTLSAEGHQQEGLGAGDQARMKGALVLGEGGARVALGHPRIKGLRIGMSALPVALQVTKRLGRRPPQMTSIAPLSGTPISQMSSITCSPMSMSSTEREGERTAR